MNALSIESLQRELAEKQSTVDALMKGFQMLELPTVHGLEFDVLYQPAATLEQLGGDWYDIFNLPDGRTAFSLGDVCGHGITSAVKMGQAKQAIKVAASLQVSDAMPKAVLVEANKVIFLNNQHVKFTTAVYGVIDTAASTVTYACAGHHPPVIAQPGVEARLMPNHGFALGVELEMPDVIREHRFEYEAGMLLVLYTDGILEFDHDENDGVRRLLQAARDAVESGSKHPAKFIFDNVLKDARDYIDDIAVMTIAFT